MFIYKVPKLEPGPLKKEILWRMRDLPLEELWIRYSEYTNGIITGCSLFEENMRVGVNPGIVKYSGRLYFLNEKTSVQYEPTDSWVVLKIKFSPQKHHPEYEWYEGQLVLDENLNILPNEIEVGRFKLKVGSRLRTEYQSFEDMVTEYDTVNLTHINWSFPRRSTLHPDIMLHFARSVYAHTSESSKDFSFCNTILANNGLIARESIERYAGLGEGKDYSQLSNEELFKALLGVVKLLTGSVTKEGNMQEGIFVF